MGTGQSWIPRILRPDFTWPTPIQSTIAETAPPVPPVRSPTIRRIWGVIHAGLYHLSERYCSWFDIPFNPNVLDLPFGLVLKWTERATLEEAGSMQMARAAGMPVPRVLCCGEHPGNPFNRTFSILMTRLPGISLVNSADALAVEAEEPWIDELKKCLDAMRLWKSPDNYWDIHSQHSSTLPCHGPGCK